MANNFTSNPWVLDTVMTTPYKAYVRIRDISWTDQGAAGDQLLIQDMNGNTVVDAKASAANVFERFGQLGWVDGFKLVTLTSGKVIVAV